jgi:mannose-6-phosphate isomerase-like protein (cupin superfamily)
MTNYKESRPWGTFENLVEEEYCKIKRIIVNPGESLSYQYHYKRSEVWTIIKGKGVFTLDGKERYAAPGKVFVIPAKAKHRIKNTGEKELIFIEVQHGSYFGEDDIVRLEDDYGR